MSATPENKTDTVLILGAGELGMAVIREFVRQTRAQACAISVLLRPSTIESPNAKKQKDIQELRKLGVTLVSVDLATSSVDALSECFGRFDTVISCTGFVGGAGTQLKLAQAALKAGVRRYVPWQFGVDYDVIGRGSPQDLFDEQLDVRDLLRSQQRMEWIIISTGMFTSFLFEPSFGVVDVENRVVRALGSWQNEVTVTTAEDIGMLTAMIYLAHPRLPNQAVFTGGDTITYERLAHLVDTKFEKPFSRLLWTQQELDAELARDPESTMKKYRAVFAQGRGVAWDLADTFNVYKHVAVTDVAQWIERHLN